jgi:tetratricopeptide (TPR) repeat protein
VGLYRRLAARNADAFQPDLAMSLNNLSVDLSDLGQREDALAASHEAVELYRQLVARNGEAFQPDLATSLSNLGTRLSDLGRHEEALAAQREAGQLRSKSR